jgi:chorismate mutase / prephenate dehydratase
MAAIAVVELESSLDEQRRYIDRIDRTIVALLAERLRLGQAAGEIKRELHMPIRSREREAQVLDHVRRAATAPLSPASAERIFTAIIAETNRAQTERD